MREHPWPDALEDVVAGSRDHLGVALGGLGWIGIRCRPWLGTKLEVGKLDGHQKRIPATVVRFPFYDPEKKRPRA